MKFEHLGYFEEIFDVELGRTLGTKIVSSAYVEGRKLGEAGAIIIYPEHNMKLDKGHKQITAKTKGRKIKSIIQKFCGRRIK